MKKLALMLVLICLLSQIVFGAELLKEGDNLAEYLQENLVKYRVDLQPLSDWPEGKAAAYLYDTAMDGTTPVIIVVDDKYVIGVLQGLSPNAYYLFDSDGDGILDLRTDFGFLPFWVVLMTSTNRSQNDNISEIMDVLYQGYQSNEGPMRNTIIAAQAMEKFKNDPEAENRDLIYLLYFYLTHNQEIPAQSLEAIRLLDVSMRVRFNEIHPLIILYELETCLNMGQLDNARELLTALRNLDPAFIPGKVYEYQLETDEEKAKALLAELKKDHGDHWIVRQL